MSELADDHGLLAGAAALDLEGAKLDQPAAPPGSAPALPVVVDWNAEAKDLVDFMGGMLFPLYPRLEGVWTPARRDTLATRLSAVLKKYNLNMEQLLGRWGPEIMLVTAVAPAVVPTVKAIKEDLAELREKQSEASRAAPPADRPAAPPASSSTPAAPPDTLQLHKAA